VPLLRKFVANIISSDYPINSSQSDTLQVKSPPKNQPHHLM